MSQPERHTNRAVHTEAAGPRTGGQVLVDQLLVHGVDMAFCVPGESYLAVLDALYDVGDRIKLINARHEAGAANMAEAYGKLTGKPGIAFVTRGPGACHASIGVHTAFQDSTPMIVFVGQVGRAMADREAFQEIDYRQMFRPIAKWTAEIDLAARIPEYLARAFHEATSGRPGPVVLALPEDMLTDTVTVADAKPYVSVQPAATPDQIARLRELLAGAERPLMIVGGSGWSDEACAQIVSFAEANGLPTACSFRRQDVFDNQSECFVGDLGTSTAPTLVERVKAADFLLVVGARLGEMTTQGYKIMEVPAPRQRFVHVYPAPDEIGRVFQPDLAIASSVAGFAAAANLMKPLDAKRWTAWRAAARKEFLASTEPPTTSFPLDLGRVLADLRKRLPADFIVTLDAGNFTGWLHRFLTYRRPCRQLGPTSGAMAYSVPAAVAAALAQPARLVIGCVGDGGFLMSGQEIGTAVQHGARPIILVFNNRMYGTIRMHQERDYPERVSGSDLATPDFAAFARAFGAHGERVERTEEFAPAFERAVGSAKTAVIELLIDPEQVSTRTTITALRQAAKRSASKA
jgi:acetolactate synthase-1/2/3 large subunit